MIIYGIKRAKLCPALGGLVASVSSSLRIFITKTQGGGGGRGSTSPPNETPRTLTGSASMILDADSGVTIEFIFDVGSMNGTVRCMEFEVMVLGTTSYLLATPVKTSDTILGSRTASISKDIHNTKFKIGQVPITRSLMVHVS